jgi:hypothetical protein
MSDAAGAVADRESRARAEALALAPASAFLEDNDSASFFQSLGDQIVTGPTGTNVMDVVVLLSGRPSWPAARPAKTRPRPRRVTARKPNRRRPGR